MKRKWRGEIEEKGSKRGRKRDRRERQKGGEHLEVPVPLSYVVEEFDCICASKRVSGF